MIEHSLICIMINNSCRISRNNLFVRYITDHIRALTDDGKVAYLRVFADHGILADKRTGSDPAMPSG